MRMFCLCLLGYWLFHLRFISPTHQSMYSDYLSSITFLTFKQKLALQNMEKKILTHIKYYPINVNVFWLSLCTQSRTQEFQAAYEATSELLTFIQSQVMHLVNIYDFTYTGNYLTNNDYVCFLEQPHVRKALHLGNAQFQTGDLLYEKMKAGVMREGIW